MSLLIRDEKGVVVNDLNPIITEHNGTTGDTVVLAMSVENSSPNHYYKKIGIRVSSKFPVDVSLNNPTDLPPEQYSPIIEIKRLNAKEKHSFNLKTVVPANSKEQVVTGTALSVSSLRYPIP